jgi:putative membrane protein insertion efficiency factor
MTAAALWLIRRYQQVVSPGFPSACRFEPTCSHYAYQAVESYGLFRGGWLAVKRLARCHPFSSVRYDPVP